MKSPKANAVLVDALGSALHRLDNGLGSVPGLLRRVLTEESWRIFMTPRGEVVEHDRFAEFVTTPPTKGLGASVELVRRIVADDVETLDLLDQALVGGQGERSDLVDNVNEVKRPTGNSTDQALRRLRKDAPELHAEVLAGNLTAHAAMVRAGLRPRTATVRLDDPAAIARTLRKQLDPETLAALLQELGGAATMRGETE